MEARHICQVLFLGLFLIEMGPPTPAKVRPGPGYKGHPDKELGMLYGVQGLWDRMHSHRAL